MEIILGYLAGLLTLINPCVLPVLPIALASSLSGHRLGPVALAGGMTLAFTTMGVALSALGPAIGLTPELFSQIGAAIMIGFGIILLVPRFNEQFATATSGFANSANTKMNQLGDGMGDNGLRTQFLAGILLGAVWVPCIGPTIGGAIALASQGESLVWAGAIMLAFSLGVSTLILAFAYGAREAIRARQDRMRGLAEKAKPILGGIFIIVGLLIFFGILPMIEGMLLDIMPIWLQDLSVSI